MSLSENKALYLASLNGDLTKVTELLASGADPNFIYPPIPTGWSVLTAAIENGHIDVLACLLEDSRTNFNLKCNAEHTALSWACKRENKKAVREIMKYMNLDNNFPNVDSSTIIDLTFECERYDDEDEDWEEKAYNDEVVVLPSNPSEWEVISSDDEDEEDILKEDSDDWELDILVEKYKELKKRAKSFEETCRHEERKSELEDLKAKHMKELEEMTNLHLAEQKDEDIKRAQFLKEKQELKRKIRVQTISPTPKMPECPVCLELMCPPQTIHNCKNGHIVCGTCKPDLFICPNCSELISERNLALERFLSDVC